MHSRPNMNACFRRSAPISPSRWKTRASIRKHATRSSVFSRIWTWLAKSSEACFPTARARFPGSTSPRPTFPRANWEATSTISCPTAKAVSASRSVTFPAKALPLRSMARSPSVCCARIWPRTCARPRQSQRLSIRLEGIPLGLIPDTQYDETTIELTPGDVVLFASDGILESENAEQEEFGPKRLSALLSGLSQRDSAREIAEQIMAATDGHSGAGVAPHDDRTLVVLRVTDDSASDFSKLPIIY